ncbi:putative Ig domain-containing protein [Larkinella humicola]|uniref:NHL repeat-containing protein n=1 Tax=Larkinella humicola TaxID=2607654 RepID=A0A5N1JV28_9BACT|nr:putative Ig domain-containing protein [Larkinella humicola]KAA9357623.1 hypothetical protein F0P93_07795 [Larkinella humicola]
MKLILRFRPAMRSMAQSFFCLVLLIGLLPIKLMAQFCANGVTVATGDYLNYVVVDAAGNVYISDRNDHRILKYAPGSTQGVVFAGGNGEGEALNQMRYPRGIALDASGNLYVADLLSQRVIRFPPNSTSETLGTVVAGGNGYGDLPNQLHNPCDVALDGTGNLYVASTNNNRVIMFPPNSTSATSGTIVAGGNGEGNALNQFVSEGIFVDTNGTLFVADPDNFRVLKFPAGSTSATPGIIVAGGNGEGDKPNQIAVVDIWIDESGRMFGSEPGKDRVLMFPPNSTSLTAGIPVVGGKEESSETNRLYSPRSVTIDAAGNLYVCDAGNDRVRRFSAGGSPTPVVSLPSSVPQPISQNTPNITLTVSGCEGGTVSWTVSNGSSGSGATIPVLTSDVGTLLYSASCNVEGLCTASPGSISVQVIASSTPVTGSFDGFLYGADCSSFRGWAWDKNKPNTVVSVDIYDGATLKATLAANEFRQDLKDAGKGNGIHAFRWAIPGELKDGEVHSLSARVTGASFTLKSGPKTIQCQSNTPPANRPPVAPAVTPLMAQQGVAFNTVLPAFTDPEASTLNYGLVTLPAGLTFTSATRQISGTPTEVGAFTLTYSASDGDLNTSVNLLLTVNPASTTTVTGNFEGFLDKVECGTIRGWVWDRNKPNSPVTVEFYTGSSVWGSTVANLFRQDLKDAGKGNGAHAYSFEVPSVLKDGVARIISARVLGSTYDLKWSGKTLLCPSPARLSAETVSGLQVTVLGNPVSETAEVEIRGAEGQSLRLQLVDRRGLVVREQQVEKARTVERQTLSVGKTAPGLLLLRVYSPTQSQTLKLIKP